MIPRALELRVTAFVRSDVVYACYGNDIALFALHVGTVWLVSKQSLRHVVLLVVVAIEEMTVAA
jgi:hypothetical protein